MFRTAIKLGLIAAMPTSCMAQSVHSYDGMPLNEQRASVGIAIPFGNGGTRSERRARVEFGVDHRRPQPDNWQLSRFPADTRVKTRIGFTLSATPTLTLNGRELRTVEGKANLSTGAKIVLGTALLAGASYLVLLEIAASRSD
jgi:hypothetical protein